MTNAQSLFSRSQDGFGGTPAPITINTTPGQTDTYTLGGVVYKSRRQLLVRLTRHPEARHWTFNRYFRIGRHSKASPYDPPHGVSPIMELFGQLSGLQTPGCRLVGQKPAPQYKVGIDLEHRSKEVAKLLFAGFGHKIYAAGYDPDDVLQTVYYGLLIRNKGTCPYRPDGPASFGHYVHMVCGCVLSNYSRQQRRIKAMEQTGIVGFGTDDDVFGGQTDVATASGTRLDMSVKFDTTQTVTDDFVRYLDDTITKKWPKKSKTDKAIIKDVLPMVVHGYDRQEIAAFMGTTMSKTSKSIRVIRDAMSKYQIEM